MSSLSSRRLAVCAVLLLLMTATRFTHAAGAGVLPDASWAVLFLGGFYLARDWRWAFALLLVAAVAADGLAIGYYGISNYCATAAYWFIVPAYSALWLGGAWLRRRYRRTAEDLARLLVSFTVSVTLCLAITHSAFYWLGGRVEHPSLGEWGSVFVQWYPLFVGVTGLYVAVATSVHIALTSRSLTAALQTHRDART
jgi:hypothetical protein